MSCRLNVDWFHLKYVALLLMLWIFFLVFSFVDLLQLDAAAPILAKLKQPIIIAKLNADKYSRLARKLEIEYVSIYLSLFSFASISFANCSNRESEMFFLFKVTYC